MIKLQGIEEYILKENIKFQVDRLKLTAETV